MRRPRLNFRLSTLMMLVAVIAIVLGRSVHFSNLARHHEDERTRLISGDLDLYVLMTPDQPGLSMHPDSGRPIAKVVVPIRAFIAYHLELEKKYDSASHHPWLPVSRDPSPPPKPSRASMELYRALLDET